MAIQRAEDKTAQMQARAGAIDELIASGALDDASAVNNGDDISRELEAMSSQSEVEAELARLKSGGPTPAIEGGDSSSGILESDPPAQTQATGDTAGEQK
jgi:phage shock protein A